MYLLSSKLKSEQTPSQSPGKTPSMSLFWLLAGCYGVQQFAWQILTCLQTFAYCSPSSGRIVKSVVQTEKCTGLHCIKEQLLLCKQIFFSFSLIHTVLKYNGCCLQSSWHLSCKLQRTMRIWKFPKVFFFFFFLVQRPLYPVLPKFAQHYPATTSQPVCQYTLFPNDQRLPGGLQPVSRLLWPRPPFSQHSYWLFLFNKLVRISLKNDILKNCKRPLCPDETKTETLQGS